MEKAYAGRYHVRILLQNLQNDFADLILLIITNSYRVYCLSLSLLYVIIITRFRCKILNETSSMITRHLRRYLPLFVLCALFSSKAAFAQPSLKATYSATLPSGFALTVKRIRVASDGSVYALGTLTTGFSKVSADGSAVTTTNYSVTIPASTGADLSISGDKFYIATSAGGNGRLFRFDVSGTSAALVASINQSGSGSVALLPPDGDSVYSSRSTGIKSYNTTLSASSATTNVSTSIARMAVTSDSILYYLGTTGSLIRSTDFASSGETTLVTGLGNSVSLNSLVIAPDSSAAYVGYSTSIRKYSLPVSGSPVLLWTQSYSNTLAGMDIDSSGNIYTVQFSGAISTYWPIAVTTSFSSAAQENSVNLNWMNSAVTSDFSGVTIRRSTVTYPTLATEGDPVWVVLL